MEKYEELYYKLITAICEATQLLKKAKSDAEHDYLEVKELYDMVGNENLQTQKPQP